MDIDQLKLLPLLESDVPDLAEIMERAFEEDARIHLEENDLGSQGYDLYFLKRWGLSEEATSYKIVYKDKMIGGVLLWLQEKKHTHFLGNLFLDVNYQNQGIGTQVWNMIEAMYPDTISWSTETPGYARRDHYFYVSKCGFHITRIDNPKDSYGSTYILEKNMAL